MTKKTNNSKITQIKETESELPPCGCAIGDLLALQTETGLPLPDVTLSDLSEKPAETDLPPCGCAIGDLLAMQDKTKIPSSEGTKKDSSKGDE